MPLVTLLSLVEQCPWTLPHMHTRRPKAKLLLHHFQVLMELLSHVIQVLRSSSRFPLQRLQVLSFLKALLPQLHQVALLMVSLRFLLCLQLLKIHLAQICSGGKSLRSRLRSRGPTGLLTLTWT